jgi:hypothetical protein
MPLPESRGRRSRLESEPPAQLDDEGEPRDPARGAAAGPRARRHRRPQSSGPPPIAVIGLGTGAIALGVLLYFLTRSREPDAPSVAPEAAARPASPSPPPQSTTSSSPAPAPAPDPTASGASESKTARAEPPAPPRLPPPSPRAVERRIERATTAAEAEGAAREAERLADAALVEKAWARVLELDAAHAVARERLDVRHLDPARELPGFTEIAGTPQRVHLRPFQDAAAKETTRAERAALLARWGSARAKLEERAARARTEPFWNEVDQVRQRLAQQDFFSTLTYEMVERPPYALFVEVEGTPQEREKRLVEAQKSYVPFLDAYDSKIRSYLFPLAPKPPQAEPTFPVFVLLRVERYRDYFVSQRGHAPAGGLRAHFEPWSKHCITYSPVIKVGLGAFEEGVQALLHELTHAWVDRLASKDGGESRTIECLGSHWFNEGIAEYLSCQFMHAGEVRFQPWRSQRVAGQYRPPGWRIPLREALAIPIHGLDAIAASKVSELPPDKREAAMSTISSGFYADMSNFILWLNLRSGANRPAQFEAYAREELAGQGGLETFKRCVPGLLEEVPDLDAAVDEFVKRIASGKINPYKEFPEAQSPAPGR